MFHCPAVFQVSAAVPLAVLLDPWVLGEHAGRWAPCPVFVDHVLRHRTMFSNIYMAVNKKRSNKYRIIKRGFPEAYGHGAKWEEPKNFCLQQAFQRRFQRTKLETRPPGCGFELQHHAKGPRSPRLNSGDKGLAEDLPGAVEWARRVWKIERTEQMRTFFYILRCDPARRDYGQRDIVNCRPNKISFLLEELGAVILGEGRTREEAFANSRSV